MGTIALIETGAANVFNIENALLRLGHGVNRVRSAEDLRDFDGIVFPGVANFGYVAQTLRSRGLDVAIRDAIDRGYPYLGICVGMQMLYAASEEAPGVAGLRVFGATVARLRGPKVPQIGWNRVEWCAPGAVSDDWVYYANSFAAPADAPGTIAVSTFGEPFAAACRRGNVTGVQFHPERSGVYGLSVLESLLSPARRLHAC